MVRQRHLSSHLPPQVQPAALLPVAVLPALAVQVAQQHLVQPLLRAALG
jgi:hypothetical protein